jgi:pimeloyl-ACP methyl ester carboxylesterase
MPALQIDPTLTMHYEDDDFTDPWRRKPRTVMLIHGAAESSQAWYAWVPLLARWVRVLRPDLRGFGRSTVPENPEQYDWSTTGFGEDLVRFLDALDIDAVHVVGAKLGGSIALQFAADHPERTRTVTVVSGPVRPYAPGGAVNIADFEGMIREKGVRGWVEATQEGRLGSTAPTDLIAWWTDYMAHADAGVCIGVTRAAGGLDLTDILPRIDPPTLVLTAQGSGLQTVEATRQWQALIPNSELEVLPGDAYHPAATDPDECARRVLAFLHRHSRADRRSFGSPEQRAVS